MKDLFEIRLRRTDTNKRATIVPFDVATIKRTLEDEGEGHRRAVAPSMRLTFYTDDLTAFLSPFPETANSVLCEVRYYELFNEDEKTLVFAGVGEHFPIENIKFNDETTTIELTSVVLTWDSDEPGMKDGDDYYKFISIKDALTLFNSVYKITSTESISI